MGDCFGQYPFLDPSYDTDERYQKMCQQICAHSQWIRSVLIFSPLHKVNETHYEKVIATCSDDEYLKFWGIKDGHSIEKYRLGFMMNCLEEFFFREEGIKKQMFIIGGELGCLVIYDYSTNKIFKELKGSSSNVLSVKVLPDKKDPLSKNSFVVSGNSKGEVRFWNWQKGITIHRIKLGIQPVQSIGVFNQNKKGVTTLVNSYEHKICVWSMSNKKIRKIRQFEQHTNWIRSIMCETIKSPDQSENKNPKEIIISAGDDNVIRFFDLKSGNCSKTLQIHTSGIIYIDILQNSLISCESRGRIAITHLDTMNTSYIATGLCLDYYRGFSVEHNETDNQAYLCVIGSSPKKSSYHFLNVYKGKLLRNNVIFDLPDQDKDKEKIIEIEG